MAKGEKYASKNKGTKKDTKKSQALFKLVIFWGVYSAGTSLINVYLNNGPQKSFRSPQERTGYQDYT